LNRGVVKSGLKVGIFIHQDVKMKYLNSGTILRNNQGIPRYSGRVL